MRVLARDVAEGRAAGGGAVEVSGWVHRIRDLGGITFVILRDRSGSLQLALSGNAGLSLESVITARGTPAANEKAPGGTELRVESLTVLSKAAADLPFQVNGDVAKTGLESLLDHRILSLRNPKILSIFRVQATIVESFAAYLRTQDFTEIKTSKLVA